MRPAPKRGRRAARTQIWRGRATKRRARARGLTRRRARRWAARRAAGEFAGGGGGGGGEEEAGSVGEAREGSAVEVRKGPAAEVRSGSMVEARDGGSWAEVGADGDGAEVGEAAEVRAMSVTRSIMRWGGAGAAREERVRGGGGVVAGGLVAGSEKGDAAERETLVGVTEKDGGAWVGKWGADGKDAAPGLMGFGFRTGGGGAGDAGNGETPAGLSTGECGTGEK